MDKCYSVEWNSHEGEPELVEIFKSFDNAMKHCVRALEESKVEEEEFNPDFVYHIVVETTENATWAELHSVKKDIEDGVTACLEWYKIKTWEFADA